MDKKSLLTTWAILLLGLTACGSPAEPTLTVAPAIEATSSPTAIPATHTPTVTSLPTQTPDTSVAEAVDTPTEAAEMEPFGITSPAFEEAQEIPEQFSCEGEDVSPQLDWTGIPEGTASLALIVDDPDAPAGTWVHWVLYDLPADSAGLAQGVQGVGVDGESSFGRPGYGGPCPPRGSSHRYYFKLYALDTLLELPAGAKKADVEAAMQGHILAEASLMGTFAR